MRRLTLALAAALAAAQVPATGPQVHTFLSPIDDSDQPYALYVPRNYSAAKKYPLVISLHGAYSNHRLNLRRVFGQGNRPGESDLRATRYFPELKEVEFIVASPLARGTMGYQSIAEKDVYDVLADVKRQFSVDEDRVYLTGLSMGGGGTLWIGLTRPDVWAAIAPVCPAPPNGTEELAGNALHVPVKLFQGAIDPVVPVAQTRAWNERLKDVGVAVEYVEYPTVRHNSWDNAYRDGAIFDWFSKFKRVRMPNRVQFSTWDYQHANAYWVQVDGLTPGVLATINAEFTGPNALKIATKNLNGFTLRLKGHPMMKNSRRVVVNVDGTRLRARVAEEVSFQQARKGWTVTKTPASAGKQRGAEGPIMSALSERSIYVYGTRGAGLSDEIERRREVAARAADWSSPRLKLLLNFRVISDEETSRADLDGANLVVFGNRLTNSVIEKMAAELPLHLNPGAADYGLVYVYPVGGRYVVVSSGLPWWTRLDQVKRPGLPFVPEAVRVLQSFGDFILYKGGLDNVIVEGRFDRNWKLPAGALEALRATGAVEVRE